jgi:proteasome lid subunit RPN8/RPN11
MDDSSRLHAAPIGALSIAEMVDAIPISSDLALTRRLPRRDADGTPFGVEVAARMYTFRLAGDPGGVECTVPLHGAAQLAHAVIADEIVECSVAVFLDDAARIMGYTVVSRGTLNRTYEAPRDVLRPALLVGASAVVLAHNHPLGDATPSKADLEHLCFMQQAFDWVGLRLLDCIVVVRDGWRSVREALLPALLTEVKERDERSTTEVAPRCVNTRGRGRHLHRRSQR